MAVQSDAHTQRQVLIGQAHKRRFRLHRQPELLSQLKAATIDALRAELEAARQARKPELDLIEEDQEAPQQWWQSIGG